MLLILLHMWLTQPTITANKLEPTVRFWHLQEASQTFNNQFELQPAVRNLQPASGIYGIDQ